MIIKNLQDLDNNYSLILADPPWKYNKGGAKKVRPKTSGKPLDYPTLSFDEIKEHLRIATEHTTDNSILFLWTLDKYLFEAQKIAEDLGYKLHARMIWDKEIGIPAAFTIRFGVEYMLYMYKGKLLPVATEERGKIHQCFHEKPKKHSQKPDISFEIINRLYPNTKKLEMYARNEREDWDCWGNEVCQLEVK